MSKLIDLTGKTFERLRVVERAGSYINVDGMNCAAQWLCECECGNQTIVLARNLTTGRTRSCGCLRSEVLRNRRKKV